MRLSKVELIKKCSHFTTEGRTVIVLLIFMVYLGFNEPDVIREATAARKDAKKVTEVVKQAPSVVKQSDLCCVLL